MPDYKTGLPTNYYFGGGDDATAGTPLAVALLLSAILLIFVLPRKYAYVPFLVAALLLPLHVVVLVGSLHFNATRILVLSGWLRLLVRRERFPGRLQPIDKIIPASAIISAIMYGMLWQDLGAVINRAGWLVTTMGAYFFLRFLIQDKEDMVRAIMTFAAVVILIAPLMWYEHLSADNPFWLLGAPEITDVRDGQIRAQGPFGHAIVAGTVGAVLMPLFVGLFLSRRRTRWLAVAGVIGSTVMVLASRSSTPVLTAAAVIFGLAMWPMRNRTRAVRWGLAILLLIIQLSMSSPIWFLMNRASGVLGGSGWHRSMLVDNFFRHFPDWWLVGTRANADWGWSMWDVDNAYVAAGLSGGLLSFILFLAVLVYAYKSVGRGRKLTEKSPREQQLIWGLGVSLFANTVAYFGIVYFDQAIVAWYTLLAMIAIVPAFAARELSRQKPLRVTKPALSEETVDPGLMNPSPDPVLRNL